MSPGSNHAAIGYRYCNYLSAKHLLHADNLFEIVYYFTRNREFIFTEVLLHIRAIFTSSCYHLPALITVIITVVSHLLKQTARHLTFLCELSALTRHLTLSHSISTAWIWFFFFTYISNWLICSSYTCTHTHTHCACNIKLMWFATSYLFRVWNPK